MIRLVEFLLLLFNGLARAQGPELRIYRSRQDGIGHWRAPADGFPIIIALGISSQLALTAFMIWFSQGAVHPPAMDAREPEIVFRNLLLEHPAQIMPWRSTSVALPAAPRNSSSSLLQDYEMESFLLRRRESARGFAQP